MALDDFRDTVQVPILVNHSHLSLRGYRSPKENATIKGYTEFSRHVQGIAADITIPSMTVSATADVARQFGFTFVLPYPKQHFVHVDMRSKL